ncbi:MAG: AAA family ATPase [Candidatus Stygibacter australis]|nr:AAA family ATPase [Candidatus Stygibacter australis]
MELIYLWIEEYGNICKQGVNFGGSYKVSNKIIRERSIYELHENGGFIKNFFNYNANTQKSTLEEKAELKIGNITTIIGQNGVGKTSIVRIIISVLTNTNPGINFAILYDESNRKFYITKTKDNKELVIKIPRGLNYEYYIPYSPYNNETTDLRYKIIYYSDIIEWNNLLGNNDKFDNMSSGSLLIGNYGYREAGLEYMYDRDPLLQFTFTDTELQLQAYNNLKKIEKNTEESIFIVKLPEFLIIEKSWDFFSKINNAIDNNTTLRTGNSMIKDGERSEKDIIYGIRELFPNHKNEPRDEISDKERLVRDIFELYNKLYNRYCNDGYNRNHDKIKMIERIGLYINLYLSTIYIPKIFIEKEHDTLQYLNLPKEIFNNIDNLDYLLKTFMDYLKQVAIIDNKRVINELIEVINWFENNFSNLTECKSIRDSNYHLNRINFIKYDREVDFKKRDTDMTKFLILYDKYKGLVKHVSILNFRWPGLSSGEISYLRLLSRLNTSLQNAIRDNYKSIILLMDEPDVYFHPEWSRLFIYKLITVLCNFPVNKKDINIQIIYTSNNPITLSDLPNNNVIQLKKQNGRTRVISNKDKFTFAANIYDILADSYFLEDGFIGAFSRRVIDEVINWINKDKSKDEDSFEYYFQHYKKIILLIGDTVIRTKLTKMLLSTIEDKDERKREIRKTINELNQMLED